MYKKLISHDKYDYMLTSDIEAYKIEYGQLCSTYLSKPHVYIFIDPLISYITKVCREIDGLTIVTDINKADVIIIPNMIPFDNSTGGYQNWFWEDNNTLKGYDISYICNREEFISDCNNIKEISKKTKSFVYDRLFEYPKEKLVSLSEFSDNRLSISKISCKTIQEYLGSSDVAVVELGCALFIQHGLSMDYFNIVQMALQYKFVFTTYIRNHPQYRIALNLILPTFFETTFYTHLKYVFGYTKKQQDTVLKELSKQIEIVELHFNTVIRFCLKHKYDLKIFIVNPEQTSEVNCTLKIPYIAKSKCAPCEKIDKTRILSADLDIAHCIDVYSEFFDVLTTTEQQLLLTKFENYIKTNLLQALFLYEDSFENLFTVKLIKR